MDTGAVMNKRIQQLKYVLLDSISAGVSWFLFYLFRKHVIETDLNVLYPFFLSDTRLWFGVFSITIFWLILYLLFGNYKDIYRRSRLYDFGQTFIQSFFGVLVIFFVAILDDIIPSYKNYYQSISTLFFIHISLTYFLRFILTTYTVHKIHRREIGFKTLIVGGSDSAILMYRNLTESIKSSGNLIVGFVNGMDEKGYKLKQYLPYLGSYKDLRSVIESKNIEEVLIAIERSEQHHILEEIINDLEGVDVLIKVKPNNYDILSGSVRMKSMFDVPLIEIKHDLMPLWQFTLKRVIDIFISILALILLLPLFIIVIILVKAGSRGPIFYYQERIGIHRKQFNIIKFRSMYIDAENNGPQLSSNNDSRITNFGRFMRRYRIDELPQFWNVLIGEMSIVGPRPERLFYADQIVKKAPYYKHIHKVKPGITSWGMVRFGYASTIDEMITRLRYDIIYIENMSLLNDLKVLIYTFKIVFQGRGK